MTVLIVDDEPYMVTYIAGLVDWNLYGFDRVLTANGGSLARDLIRDHRPELLVTDIRMPKISGLDLSRYIEENGLNTKVIILSGYSDFEYAKQALHYGVSDYLVKPVLRQDFVETLERVMQKYFERETAAQRAGGPKEREDVIAYLKSYIGENYARDLSLEMLGEVVHLHPSYLSKIFKDHAGMNLSCYITDVRMQKAAKLLEETEDKVQEVMIRVGYRKSQHFSRLFKEKYGVTPKEYRQGIRRACFCPHGHLNQTDNP